MDKLANSIVMRPPDGAVFSFDPGSLSLELLATGGPGELSVFETLRQPEDWEQWLAASRLRLNPADLWITTEEPAAVRAVRDAMWRLVRATINGSFLPEPDITVLNAAAGHPPMVPTLTSESTRSWLTPVSGPQALSTVARDAITLLIGPYARRIRECSSNDCSLVFVDTSRPGKRRWCSMDRCGNRSKVRALRARRTEDAS